jgi:hypothetical protein
MTQKTQRTIMEDLDLMIKRASEVPTEGLRKAASPADPLDSDNGTEAVKKGEHYNKNVEEAGKHTAAKVDGGAEANKPGASVEASTEGATAVSTDGQEGGKGADLEVKGEADNGPVPQSELSKSAAELISTGRKISAYLKSAAEKAPVDANAAAAQQKVASILGKSNGQPEAAKPLTGMSAYIAKKAMEAAGGEAIPGGEQGAAQAGAQELMQALQNGEIDDEQAAQILQEAARSGALSPEDLQELQALSEQMGGAAGAGGDPAAAGAPPGGDAGAPPADAMGGAGPAGALPPGGDAGGELPPEDLQAMKVAALDVGPGHPDYPQKLRTLHKAAHTFGFNLAIKTAQELEEAARHEAGEGEGHEGSEGAKAEEGKKEGDSAAHEQGESPAQENAEHLPGGEEAGIPGGDPAAAAAGIPGGDPAAGIPGAAPTGSPINGDPLAGLEAKTPEEQAALMQVLQEMGIDPQELANLRAAPVPAMDKVASYKARVSAAIFKKAAALQIAQTSTNKKA